MLDKMGYQDSWTITHSATVISKVVFDRAVSPEEAAKLFHLGEYEDIIDQDFHITQYDEVIEVK